MTTNPEKEELKALITEAHQLLKDMRREKKEIKELIERAVPEKIDKAMDEVITESLVKYFDQIQAGMKTVEAKIFKRFNEVFAILMGEDKASKRQGKKSIPELLEETFNR